MSRNVRAATLALTVLLSLAGCATVPPATPPAPATAQPATPAVAQVVQPGVPAPPVAVAADTVPSADALAVLAEIPDPLRPEERTATPAGSRVVSPPAAAAPPNLRDSAASGPADAGGGQADVPVPSRMPALGERPLPEAVAATDTAAAPATPAPPALARSPVAAAPDTCWRVQLAAWAERAKAERYLAAGRSQLAVPLAIEKEAGLFKVRTSGCLGSTAADSLRRRAREAGFDGAFRFRGGKP